jgi:hypothetical protein
MNIYHKEITPIVYKHLVKQAIFITIDNKYLNDKYYVKVTLKKYDDNSDISECLSGTLYELCSYTRLIFKDIKVTKTSKQLNSKVYLEFYLMEINDKTHTRVPNISVKTNVFDVVSHSKYLENQFRKPTACIHTIVPKILYTTPTVKSTKLVIVGDNLNLLYKPIIVINSNVVTEYKISSDNIVIFINTSTMKDTNTLSVINDCSDFRHTEIFDHVTIE